MFAFGIQPGRCYHGRCCDGEFVIQVDTVTERGCAVGTSSWECTGDLVFLNGHTMTDNFPSTVMDGMAVVEISAEDFKRIHTEYMRTRQTIADMMREARGKVVSDLRPYICD